MRGSIAWGVVLSAFACSERVRPMPACPPECPVSTDARHVGRQASPNPVPAENARPGDPGWRKGRSAREGELDAYATADVLEAGDRLTVRVSANPAAVIEANVYRVGDYAGAGARRVATLGAVDATPQPACPVDTASGLVECPWSDTLAFSVDPAWPSGLYLLKLARADAAFRFVPFVVRDRRAAELYFVSALHTAQAYNRWGGVSLYADETGSVPNGRAHVVSYDRPFRESDGAGQMLRWEAHLVRYLESQGYDVTYGASSEFERFDDALVGIGAVVAAGHDEYWVPAQRSQLDAALDQGRTSLAYFGANGGYWRVRTEPAPDGRPMRRIACFKEDAREDPIPGSTTRFRDAPDPRPENALFGSWYLSYQLFGFPLVVADPSDWTLDGAGFSAGEALPGLLGYEFDGLGDNGLTPSGTQVVMESPTLTTAGLPSASHLVERVLDNGRVVFSAGSIYFPLALSAESELRDDRLGRVVSNVLERAVSHRRPPRVLSAPGAVRPASTPATGNYARAVDVFARGFAGPTGLASMSDGRLVVAETGRDRIRLVSADGLQTETIAGDGRPGDRDGPGVIARFRQPTGVAVRSDGAVVVADTLNHVVRLITRVASGWEVSTLAGAAQQAGAADGLASMARFNRPSAVAVMADGNVLVADQGGQRIRRIEAITGTVTTLAGSGAAGNTDGTGPQASFNEPSAIAISGDAAFVYDAGSARLRRLELDGDARVTTVGGSTHGFADGSGDVARFRAQLGLAALPTGELVLADAANYRLRLIVPGPTSAATRVTTLAGSGAFGARLGDGAGTDLVVPTGVAARTDGAIAVSASHAGLVLVVRR